MSFTNMRHLLETLVQHKPIIVRSVRLYGRWTHRQPAKTLLPFESTSKANLKKEKVIDLDPAVFNKSLEKPVQSTHIKEDQPGSKFPSEKVKEIKANRDQKLKKRKFYLSQQKVFDDSNGIIFEKLKEKDGWLSSLLTNLKSKKERMRSQEMMVEGWRLIVDGLEAMCNLKYVIFSRMEDLHTLRPFLPNTGVKFFKIPYKEIALWSDVETSPGIFGVFDIPTQDNIKRLSKPLPLHLICDNIRIPGNMGAILRAALGAGCDKVLLTKGCVDVWDPKVVRSAAGAHFRLPIHYSIDWDEMPKHLEESTSIFIADNNTNVVDENELESNESLELPVIPYYGMEYATLKHITLIIGGETEGISDESYRLAASRNGLRLNIPLEKGVDSLNTGMATAVIALEIRKQLIQAWTKLRLDRQLAKVT